MINTIQMPRAAYDQNLVVIRALSSITSEQAGTIAQVVRASAQLWDIQAVDDYDGYLSILIEPFVSGDEQKPLFISGTAQNLELFEAQDDDLTLINAFYGMESLVAQLNGLLNRK